MRRDPGYREAYKEVKKLRAEFSLQGLRNPQKIRAYFMSPQGEKEKEFSKKFGLYCDCMIDPKKSFEALKAGRNTMEKIFFFSTLFWEHWGSVNTTGSRCVITIDFDNINSLENLKTEVSHLIDLQYREFYKRHYKQRHGCKRSIRRIKEEDLEDILMVGDLKLQEVETLEIASRLLGGHKTKEDPQAARIKVSQHFKRYQELISGGYKELTYP